MCPLTDLSSLAALPLVILRQHRVRGRCRQSAEGHCVASSRRRARAGAGGRRRGRHRDSSERAGEWRSWGDKWPGAVLTAVAATGVCACGQTCLCVQVMEPVMSHCTWPPWKAWVVTGCKRVRSSAASNSGLSTAQQIVAWVVAAATFCRLARSMARLCRTKHLCLFD